MGKMETRELTVAQIYNIVSFYVEELAKQSKGDDSILNHFSNLLNWKLKRNIDILQSTAQSFEEFREKLKKEFINEWATDEKSIKDESGTRIKREYFDEFAKAQEEVNTKIQEVLEDRVEFAINVLDVESEIENIINEIADVDVRKIDWLMFMNTNE